MQTTQQQQQKKNNFERKHLAFLINEIHTEIIIEGFLDKILIIITQLNKPGFLIFKILIIFRYNHLRKKGRNGRYF